jgi:hypothetical protein
MTPQGRVVAESQFFRFPDLQIFSSSRERTLVKRSVDGKYRHIADVRFLQQKLPADGWHTCNLAQQQYKLAVIINKIEQNKSRREKLCINYMAGN